MTTGEDLRARVAAAYDALDLPSWPPPRGPMAEPREEEYTRVTDPGRYRIVHERARLWVEVLRGLPGVSVSTLNPPAVSPDDIKSYAQGTSLTLDPESSRRLILLERIVPLIQQDGDLAILRICADTTDDTVAMLPDCGCDACDGGSDDLLEAIDNAVVSVIERPFVGQGWLS